jgi:hypothetical protein
MCEEDGDCGDVRCDTDSAGDFDEGLLLQVEAVAVSTR